MKPVDIKRQALTWALGIDYNVKDMTDEEVETKWNEGKIPECQSNIFVEPTICALTDAFKEDKDTEIPDWVQPFYEELTSLEANLNEARLARENEMFARWKQETSNKRSPEGI